MSTILLDSEFVKKNVIFNVLLMIILGTIHRKHPSTHSVVQWVWSTGAFYPLAVSIVVVLKQWVKSPCQETYYYYFFLTQRRRLPL
jgi:hypothetical protein